jgi:hypothetical protein
MSKIVYSTLYVAIVFLAFSVVSTFTRFDLNSAAGAVVPSVAMQHSAFASPCPSPSFGTATDFAVGRGPESVAVGDFNRDGNPDLATANTGDYSNNVSVLLSDGSGGFGTATNFGAGSGSTSVAVGDFNRDSNPDLAVANQDSSSNNVSVLLGNGSGGFGSATNFPVGNRPFSVAVSDFNGDSNLDLAVANFDSNNVSVLLGDGNGGFGAAASFPVGTNPWSVAVGDFNGDGNADLAVANYISDNVSVLLGDGNGGFGAATDFPVGRGPRSVAVSDFNRDGNLDLVTANFGYNNISVLLGDGNGGFGAATDFPVAVGAFPNSVVVGDFNHDSSPDLALANEGSDNISVLLNTCGVGTGTVTPTNTPALTPTACALTFSDVPVGSTFYPYITCLACQGIINGYPCGGPGEPCGGNNDPYFRPGNSVTRGQLSKIVSDSAGFSDPQPTQMFEDVPIGSSFQAYIGRLAIRSYISGYQCGGPGEPCGPNNLPYFRPNANISRGQIAKIDSNAAGYNDTPGAQQYEDVLPGSTFYDFIWRLSDRGLVNGYPCGGTGEPCGPGNLPYFRPGANATRGQASKIVSNTFFPNCPF